MNGRGLSWNTTVGDIIPSLHDGRFLGDLGALYVKIDGVAATPSAKIDRVGAELKSEFALIRSEMEVLRRDLTIRLGSMIVVATGVLLAAKFFS